jgi:aspartyl-tRNA(Asn)/glutamyl-tRNA(Gln) amidotransferase subunit A
MALVEQALARIERLNPTLNAFVTVLADSARQQAATLDAELGRGQCRGPLHGIVVGVKDIIHVEGVPTRAGSRSVGTLIPQQDATCVARLRAAGAIILGKLHSHELAGGMTSENELYGRARNPWNPDYIPGGSSGGSAIATAAGLVHGALGTDTGGSIRVPAAFCGVVGLKGTFSRVSRSGVLTRSWTMDHVGTFARRVRDAVLLFEAIAGFDPADPYASRRAAPNLVARLNSDVRGIRVGVLRGQFFETSLDPQIGSAFDIALRSLETLGMRLIPVRLDLVAAAHAAGTIITVAEADSTHEQVLRERPQQLGGDLRVQLRAAEFISARQYLHALRIRAKVQLELEALFGSVDVLITPTTSALPTRSEGRTTAGSLLHFARNTRPFSMAGLPAISLPAGISTEGLPIGLQVVGRPFDELTVLRVANAYESATQWHTLTPPD